MPSISLVLENTNTTLSDAISSAESELGNNSMVFAGTLAPFNGFLVYMLLAVDDSNNISGAIVDAGDGEVLASKPIDLSGKHHDRKGMMGPKTVTAPEVWKCYKCNLLFRDQLCIRKYQIIQLEGSTEGWEYQISQS